MGERVLSFVGLSLIQENLEADAERRSEGAKGRLYATNESYSVVTGSPNIELDVN